MSEAVATTVAWEAWQCYWEAASVGDGAAMDAALALLAQAEREVAEDARIGTR